MRACRLSLFSTRQAAVGEYGTAAYRARQAACMALDVSWDKPAAEWEALLRRMAAGELESH